MFSLPAVAVLSIAALIKKVFPRKRDEDAQVVDDDNLKGPL